MQPKRYYHQLKSVSGADTVAIDVTNASRQASFRFDDVPVKVGREWCYADSIRLAIRTQIDQPAAGGAIIRYDQWGRMISNFQLKTDDLGILIGENDITGQQMALIAQVVSNRYAFPWIPREDLAAADGDTAITWYLTIPIGHKCFMKGHQTNIWSGWFRQNGRLDVNFAASTWPADVSTGAAAEATTDIRAELVYTQEPEARPPTIWAWRQHTTPGNETRHAIPDVCANIGVRGALRAGKIAFLAYLGDVSGLGGPDGIDNILAVFPRDRDQPRLTMGAPFYGPASFLASFIEDTRRSVIHLPDKGVAYPYQLGTAINAQPNAATAYFLPYIWPDPMGQEVSKLQEWTGPYTIEHEYTATPSGQGKWLGLEQSYLDEAHIDYLASRMGINPNQFVRYPKVRGMHDPGDAQGQAEQARKLRGLPQKFRAA